jgi:hypothetical protein
MADLRIDLAAEFRGKKAFKEADKATSSLDKAVGKLGKQIASVFAVTKIVQFGKASLKAFVEDEAAATRLATAVKNLGLAFEQPYIDNYISKLEQTSGVLDDKLRPALQALLTTTGSLSKSQEFLTMAIEASRATGIELTTVAQDIANAYNGNTRGLRKYNLGLTKAQLTTVSFTEVQKRFNAQFSGANAAFLDTYAGKLQILTVASENAKETIGKGLVDALVLAGGKDGDIQDIADAMSSLSNFTADVVRGLGALAGKFTAVDKAFSGGLLGKALTANFKYGLLGQLAALGDSTQPRPRAGRRFMGGSGGSTGTDLVEKARLAAQKKLTDAQVKAAKALTAEQKKQAVLKKAGSIFDLEQIQLIAALKGKLSDEDRKRVELQFALLTGNTAEAQKLTFELARAQGLSISIARDLASLPQAANPFTSWEAYLDMLMSKARQVASMGSGISISTGTGQGGSVIDNYKASIPQTNVTPLSTATIGRLAAPMSSGSSTIGDYLNVTLQIDGKTIASALQDTSMSGTGSSINRLTGGWKPV